jgi:hypothetical protein
MISPDHADPHVQDLYSSILVGISTGKAPEQVRTSLERDQERLYGRYPEVLEERLAALASAFELVLEQQNKVMYLQKRAITFSREQWYLGPAEHGSLWGQLRARLRGEGRSDAEINMVDEDSGILVGLLDNPSKPTFSTRGLVVGHVQSGKTGNIAAVINKAADTPYKFFLVLSGVTDQLRNQTQTRLDADVVDLAPERWMKWTVANTDNQNGDFAERAQGGFGIDHRNQIAVIKKNAGILRRFLAKLLNTDDATLRNTPFLIIDDECDQASVNSARYAQAITRINQLLRQILKKLPKAAYVGYTATPFANILIDTTVEDDLYPRNFIHGLQHPDSYFGAEALFGRHALEGEYDEGADGLDMIRVVPSADVPMLRPGRAGGGVAVTPSLTEAIRYFVMVVAARRSRGQHTSNNTMLLHTSVLNSVHRQLQSIVKPYVEALAASFGGDNPALLAAMREQWEREQAAVLSEQFDLAPVTFEQLRPHLESVAESIRVHVENWTATDRLNYKKDGAQTLIVIGGNVLARGLTLDGLTVSYFLRSSSQYDTLMQMGRWFGYRTGFEDLPRIWVEQSVRDAFFDLATVEAEIRRDISRYAEEDITPKDFAVRIRKIPGMTITAPAKMRNAIQVQVGFAGTHAQTFRFSRGDHDILKSNWAAGARALQAMQPYSQSHRRGLFRQVPANVVLAFLDEYEPHQTHRNLAKKFIREYIAKAATPGGRLSEWSIYVVEGDGAKSEFPLGGLGHVSTVVRSAEAHAGEDASIKALMSRADVLVDLADKGVTFRDQSWDELKAIRREHGGAPLLLLYPIEAKSQPRKRAEEGKKRRVALDAALDVLGYGVVFPGNKEISGAYVAANLQPDESDPTDDLGVDDRIPEELLEGVATSDAA